MQFYPFYRQDNEVEIEQFVRSQPTCLLLTSSPKGAIHTGIFNHVYVEGKFILHLNRQDEQIQDMKAHPRATLSCQEFFATIPSYWVDEQYGGAASMLYRFAEFRCDAALEENPDNMIQAAQELMERFQPEGRYKAFDAHDPIYEQSFATLAIVTLTPVASRTKWKLGQNWGTDVRRKIMAELRKRGKPGDLRAVEEMERWMAARGE